MPAIGSCCATTSPASWPAASARRTRNGTSRHHHAQPVSGREAGARRPAAPEQHRAPSRGSLHASGELEFAWGKPSAGIEGFCGCCNPVGLAMLPDGRCVTCEKGLPRVKVYSTEGVFESVVAGPETFPENAKATFVEGHGRLPVGRAGCGGGFATAYLYSRPGDQRRAGDEVESMSLNPSPKAAGHRGASSCAMGRVPPPSPAWARCWG